MRILVIEDDHATADYLRKGLTEAGHTVDIAADGEEGLMLARDADLDVIVTDRGLPGLDGIGVLKALRNSRRHKHTPVLMLTMHSSVDNRVEGLDAGADDYLSKPFAFSEFRARLDAVARRTGRAAPSAVLRHVDLELDPLTQTVRRGGRPIRLLRAEYRLLHYMMQRPGRVLTRTMLLEGIWQMNFDTGTNVVDVHMSRLRRKLEEGLADTAAPLIRTLRGSGYALGGTD